MGFEPRIVGFLCNWCSYTGADLAGTSRIPYSPSIRVIRVMCSARVDPTFVLRCLSEGADGVLILGCPEGDCHRMRLSGSHRSVVGPQFKSMAPRTRAASSPKGFV